MSRVFGKYSICSLGGKPAKNPPDSVLDAPLATGNSPDNGCACNRLNRRGAASKTAADFGLYSPKPPGLSKKPLTQSEQIC
jgi:hypothetical protein